MQVRLLPPENTEEAEEAEEAGASGTVRSKAGALEREDRHILPKMV